MSPEGMIASMLTLCVFLSVLAFWNWLKRNSE